MNSQEVQAKSGVSSLNGDIAIIGMACIFPGASDLQTFWQNIVSKVDAITDVTPGRWDPEIFYDENPDAENKIYCKRGGYISHLAKFNPLDYGVMPLVIEGGEPDQFLFLRVVYEALADAGYSDKKLDGERTEVIVGRGNYSGYGLSNAAQHTRGIEQTLLTLKELHPEYSKDELQAIKHSLLSSLPKFNSENAPSIIPNMITGRTANRLDFMGANYTVDAACASTLIATEIGVRDLLTGSCDIALVGGAYIGIDLQLLSVFCKMKAMSLSSEIRPFDEKADGTLPGEGLGVMILKRLKDAERDKDRIYAVIKGVGTSSDGRALSVTAPRVDGEELALLRAYKMSGIDPNSIELIEGHGTATPVGDAAELETLNRIWGRKDEALPPRCALGSIKSMIGHTMPAAGAAAMIKTALALYHKILPPTLNCDEPNSKVDWDKSAFYINTETRPWIHGEDTPRRAGVNAFGFGGVNGHVVLEEYRGADEEETPTLWHEWDSEVLILQAESRQSLMQKVQQLHQYLATGIQILLKDIAYTLNIQLSDEPYRLSITATSLEDLKEKLEYSLKRLSEPECKQIKNIKGVFFFEEHLAKKGKLAFLFPGEGSQYLNMLSDLCMHFPEARKIFEQADRALIDKGDSHLPSQIIFPTSFFSDENRRKAEERIWEFDSAMQAIFASNEAIYTLLKSLDIYPDMVVGHSAGDFSAMSAAGILTVNDQYFQHTVDTLYNIYKTDYDMVPRAVVLAVGSDYETVLAIASGINGDIYVAMDNCPHQVLVVCEEEVEKQMVEKLREKGIFYEKLAFDRAYHTPMFKVVVDILLTYFRQWHLKAPDIPIYSCTTMSTYPSDPEAILKLMAEHWMNPVEFRKTIEAMYEAGARIFVEVGPRGNLTSFVDDILKGKEYLAMPANVLRRSGITQLNHLIGILAAHGVSMRLDHLYERRSPELLSLNSEEDSKLLQKDEKGTMNLKLGFPELNVDSDVLTKSKAHGSDVSEQNIVLESKSPKESEPSIVSSAGSTDKQFSEERNVPHTEAIESVSDPNKLKIPTPSEESPRQRDKENETGKVVAEQSKLVPPGQNPSQDTERETSLSQGRAFSVSDTVAKDSSLPISPGVPAPSDSAPVMSQYLQTMEHFLEVQEEVMQAYLNNGEYLLSEDTLSTALPQQSMDEIATLPDEKQLSSIGIPTNGETVVLKEAPTWQDSKEISSSEEGTSQEIMDTPSQAQAELVSEENSVTMEQHNAPSALQHDTEDNVEDLSPDSESSKLKNIQDIESLTDELLEIVSEKTGYPVEMLDLTLDMEADLGIDSIKRIEILGTFQERYPSLQEQESDMEQVASLKTLKEVIDFMEEQVEEHIGESGDKEDDEPVSPEKLSSSSKVEDKGSPKPEVINQSSHEDSIPENDFPFIGNVVSFVPGQKLMALRQVNLDEDILLYDHTFGREISVDETLFSLPIIPMTVSMEIMAEAAALLQPGKLLIGMKKVQANQWIRIEGEKVTLQITAQVQDSSENYEDSDSIREVKVQIHIPDESTEKELSQLSPMIEGIMVFGNSYPTPPPVNDSPLKDEGPCQKTAKQLYEERLMFHGPRFQGVVSLDRSGSDGIEATLGTLSIDNLFRSTQNPHLITDSALLDAAGQVFGYWALEQLESGSVIFPIRLETLHIYAPNLPANQRVKCLVRIQKISSMRISMYADIVDENGKLWMRLVGWEDWRFYVPEEFANIVAFGRFPNRVVMSNPFQSFDSILDSKENSEKQKLFECYLIDKPFRKADEFWTHTSTYLILSHQERQICQNSTWQDKRKYEWLLGRMVSKDALRVYIKKNYGIELYPADIEIVNGKYGSPAPQGYWTGDIEFVPTLSLSHSNDVAIAMVGKSKFLGLDIEKISAREQGFENLSFTKEEQTLLAASSSLSGKEELQTRFWCAKEAVAKALGHGFIEGPLNLVVSDYEGKSNESEGQIGVAKIVLHGKLSDEFPEYASGKIIAYTTRYRDYIIAMTLCELE